MERHRVGIPNTVKKTEIVADIGSNHMGNIELAEAMIRGAAEIGIDTVKFQSWQARKLRKNFPDYDATYARHKKTELSDEAHKHLIEICEEVGVNFLTTCFDTERAEFLASLGLERIKVASPDCANFRLLDVLMDNFKQLIISTGMSTDDEVLRMIEHVRGHDTVILHCVSLYPTPINSVNLNRMFWLREQGLRVGFSDHSVGTEAAKLAIALGAEIVEKHFTFSRYLPGKDQSMSTTPEEFRELVTWAGLVPEIMGKPRPIPSEEELKLREIYQGKWG